MVDSSAGTFQEPNPDSYLLSKLDWDVFCTFTWKGTPPPYSIQQRVVCELTRRVTNQVYHGKDPLWDLKWAIRYELGEKTLRPHWHAVIAGNKTKHTNKHTAAAQIKYIWEDECARRRPGLRSNVGFAKVRAYDTNKPGAAYICKGTGLSEANLYELSKFRHGFEQGYGRESVTVLLAPSTLLELAKRIRRNKSQGFARFLRDLRTGSKQKPRWSRSKRSGSYVSPEKFEHPAGVSYVS